MTKLKRSKPINASVDHKISYEEEKLSKDIYKKDALFVTGVFFNPMVYDKTTLVRITFNEHNAQLNETNIKGAVIMSIEDLQSWYNGMTKLLENMRAMGRIA